jgi:hypothetical protein
MTAKQIEKILVYLEEHATAIIEKYPTLTKYFVAPVAGGVAGNVTGHYVIKGADATLQAAKAHLESKGHKHTVHHKQN